MGKLLTADRETLDLSRRAFLVTTVGAGIAFWFLPGAEAAIDPARSTAPAKLTGPTFDPTIWFSMGSDGTVVVNVIRAEMGQHVGTSLARILADELEVQWSKVRIAHVDTDPKWGLMVTGGSWSVWQTWPVFSRAGAAGRIALIEAGAKLLGVKPESCKARDGAVISGKKSITYAEIIKRGNLTVGSPGTELEFAL